MIEVNNLSVSIGNKTILRNITFSLEKGTLSIIGLNGIGKTTLLRTLAGLNKSYSGHISINQKSLSSFSHKHLSKSISFVPQEHVPYFKFTVLEMIMFGRTPHIKQFGFPTKNDFNVVEKILCDIGLEHLRERYYTELSGGEKRLVLVSMALAQETKIILFDEPTTFLDFKNAMIVINKIKNLSKELGKLIVVTMHDINQAISIADQALILYSENCFDFGNADVTINEINLQRLYGMEFKTMYDDNFKFIVPSRG